MEQLFSYGTLQLEQVQKDTFGRKLTGQLDTLIGFELSEVEITDPQVLASSGKAFHPIVKYTGKQTDKVEGTIFHITAEELAQSDAYEVDDYVRVKAKFISGKQAWIYICAKSKRP
ncbi:gamma-glutamylcyclotransferase family protein [Litorilituus sediminis]|uniref:Gamma-glutamylcyclotransferase n=1 Tax=Litorilituus sediminis TaxID=718192 RepID=A0A4P6P607_9GAMM|nr:gamma-glutamylcyclotransferase family protein [Litorilituus sediminis]QBG37011.1 gamma-glutamylcyclotransferase [Litorilituus sediminis]